jgi:membrane protein required for colicin V production
MDFFGLNALDYGVVTVVLISGLLALSRGFIREAISIGVWVGAVLGTLYGFLYARPLAREIISFQPLADGVAAIALFIASLVVLSLLGRMVARHMPGGGLGMLDRVFGLLWGLVRGGLFVSLIYLFAVVVEPETKSYEPLRDSRSAPFLEAGSAMLLSLLPDKTLETGAAALREAERAAGEIGNSLSTSDGEKTKNGAETPDQGYESGERQGMEQLLREQQ